MLMRRDGSGDREYALSLVSQALDAAQGLGMKALLERALALKLKAQGVDLTDTGTSIDAVASLVYAGEAGPAAAVSAGRDGDDPVQRHPGLDGEDGAAR